MAKQLGDDALRLTISSRTHSLPQDVEPREVRVVEVVGLLGCEVKKRLRSRGFDVIPSCALPSSLWRFAPGAVVEAGSSLTRTDVPAETFVRSLAWSGCLCVLCVECVLLLPRVSLDTYDTSRHLRHGSSFLQRIVR